ncbi:Crp/Fnr family transcriptional regulator [Desulfocurvibacter africanus]|uniref:Crp/Fnr family transcriptional regulator n=1 Tax=Desulfocurvibacter africanus TaxID=873 RepID=UPI000423585E|nr:Crp/Fnr family transcriptional regulator [Desulfocurvibacter africanus]
MPQTWHWRERDFFEDLPREKAAFLARARRRELRKREFVFHAGDAGTSCYYLESGSLRIFRATVEGKEPMVFLRRQGEMFGLAEIMTGAQRQASAQAIASAVIFEIERKDFEALLADHYPLAKRVIQILGCRLRFLGEQVEGLMVSDVVTRILKLLLQQAYPLLDDEEAWEQPVALPVTLTQEQIASLTGSCQPTVSETLRLLQEEGLIEMRRREIVLLNPLTALKRIEEPPC